MADFGRELDIVGDLGAKLAPAVEALKKTAVELEDGRSQLQKWEDAWDEAAVKAAAYAGWKKRSDKPLTADEQLKKLEGEWDAAAKKAKAYDEWKKRAGANEYLKKWEQDFSTAAKKQQEWTKKLQLGDRAKGVGGFVGAGAVMLGELGARAVEKVGQYAVDAARKIYDLGVEFVEAAGKAQDLELAIKLDVGDKGSKEIDGLAESFARTSRFSGEQIKASLLPLLEQGLTDKKQLDQLATAATDIAARRGGGLEQVQGALEAFQKIALKGEIDARALRALAISQPAFYKDLADLLHTDTKHAEELTKAGKVTSQTLLSVALHQIAEREGGALGKATVEASKTLGGTLSRLANVKENAFARLAESDGIKRVQGVLDNFVNVFEGPIGRELVSSLGDDFNELVTGIFGDLAGANGIAKMEAAIRSIKGTAKEWTDEFRQAWPGIEAGARGALLVVEGIAKAMGVIFQAIDNFQRNTRHEELVKQDRSVGILARKHDAQGGVHLLTEENRDKYLEQAGYGSVSRFLMNDWIKNRIARSEFKRELAEGGGRTEVERAAFADAASDPGAKVGEWQKFVNGKWVNANAPTASASTNVQSVGDVHVSIALPPGYSGQLPTAAEFASSFTGEMHKLFDMLNAQRGAS